MTNKARFVFYLEGLGIDEESVAVYNIIRHTNRRLLGATVTNEVLMNGYKTPVPPTPTFKKWKREVQAKRRCNACWRAIRTRAEKARHLASLHKEF